MSVKQTILVVDDDPTVREMVARFLSVKGYLVDAADSGSRALELMEKKAYDLVLSDIVMGDIDGLDLLKEAKTKYPDIPFLLITGYASLDTAIEALRLGAHDYLQKPVNYEELLLKLQGALELVRLQRAKEATEREKDDLLKKLEHYSSNLEKIVEERTEALRASEKKYMFLVENSPDTIYVLNPEGHFGFVGGAVKKLLGFSSEDLIGKHFTSVIWPDDIEKARFRFNERRTGKRATTRAELRLSVNRGEGKTFDIRCVTVELNAFGMYDKPVTENDKGFLGTYGVARDITARKRAEEALKRLNKKLLAQHKQRKLLSKRLITLLENDRRQVAMELHDQLGQTLTRLKMDLEMTLSEPGPADAASKNWIELAKDKAIQAIEDVQNIARGLRPSTLDTLGLVPSLHALFNDIKEHTDVNIRFFSQNVPKRFGPEKELAVYRIAQEALTNVIKHARAKKVFVNLAKEGNFITLGVEDDGVGFDRNEVMEVSKGKCPMGLLTMEERAVQLGGGFSIDSRVGRGTHLLVRIPV